MAEADPLLAIADELYGLRLPDFTPARDAAAREHKGTELGQRVKALRKPSLAAWVVDLLVRLETDQVEQLLAVGAALREAQESMSADDLRQLTRQRRQLTAAVTTRARGLAAEHGQRVTQAVADQVEATLTAALLDPRCGEAVRSGLLVAPLAATGVDDADPVAAVAVPEALGHAATPREAPTPARPELHVVPDPDADAKALAAAQEELDAAEEEVSEAQEAHADAAADVERLEARAMQLQSEIDELKRRLAELETTAEEVDDELGDAEEVRAEAEATLADVTATRDRARERVERLSGR